MGKIMGWTPCTWPLDAAKHRIYKGFVCPDKVSQTRTWIFAWCLLPSPFGDCCELMLLYTFPSCSANRTKRFPPHYIKYYIMAKHPDIGGVPHLTGKTTNKLFLVQQFLLVIYREEQHNPLAVTQNASHWGQDKFSGALSTGDGNRLNW